MNNLSSYLTLLAAGVIGLASLDAEAAGPKNCPPNNCPDEKEWATCTTLERFANGEAKVKECLQVDIPDIDGRKITITYDDLGRVVRREYNINPFQRSWASDIPIRLIGFYDPISGAELRAEEYLANGSLKAKITYGYNDQCRITEVLWDYDGDGVPDETLQRTLNARGEVVQNSYDTDYDGKPNVTYKYKKKPKTTTPRKPGESDTITEVDSDGDGKVDQVH